MIQLYDLASVKDFRTIEIPEQVYERYSSDTDTFPFVYNDKWVAKLIRDKFDAPFLQVFATGIRVAEKYLNTDTGIVSLKLAYFNGVREETRIFGSEILAKNDIKVLLHYGVRFEDKCAEHLVSYLIKSEALAPVHATYSKLGWDKEQPDLFKCGRAIRKGQVDESLTYDGKLDLLPKGSLETWLDMVKNEVIPHLPMTVVMLLGFASPVLTYLRDRDIQNPIFHLSNTTSKGKTTSSMLAASVFSNPILNRGNMISFHATENALVQFVGENQGITVVIDEVATGSLSDYSRLLYTFAEGRSKMRLNGDSTQKEVFEFSAVFITNAEYDLLDEESAGGLKARIFEINDPLTADAENSENIKRCIANNHGVAGEAFLVALTQDTSRIPRYYEESKQQLIDNCIEINPLTVRIFSKFAVVVATARLVEETFALGLDLEGIVDYLVELERKISSKPTPEEQLLEIIRQEVTKNSGKFKHDSGFDSPSTCYGAIKSNGKFSEIQIIVNVFMDIVDKYNLSNWKATLNKLKKQGVLIPEDEGHLYKRVKLVVPKTPCYCFRIPNDIEVKEAKRIVFDKKDLSSDMEPVTDDDILDVISTKKRG